MAKPILEDQSLDYSKPFVVELCLDGVRVEKLTYPLKSSVKSGRRGPWDQTHDVMSLDAEVR